MTFAFKRGPQYEDPHSPHCITSDKPRVGTGEDFSAATGIPQKFNESWEEYRDPFALPMQTVGDEELRAEEAEHAKNLLERQSLCVPADFNDHDRSVRYYKALMVNLYMEYGGNWSKVFKDARSVTRKTMAAYWADELFRLKIAALDPILEMEAKGVVIEVFKDGLDEKARLAAALRYLEFSNGGEWDRGIRRQMVANRGAITNTLLSRKMTDEEFLATLARDKLNKLPQEARDAIVSALGNPQLPAPENAPEVEAPPERIGVADMNKLKDPFGDVS